MRRVGGIDGGEEERALEGEGGGGGVMRGGGGYGDTTYLVGHQGLSIVIYS